ncbi:hypothetical protein [Rhodoferax sp.]|uniref:hypothetical protein n=1 Tax=Rhodoferax sp. TaxID=50421 RepID=UPI00283BB200|nr:hypothetical protein [Rhodoferax sp.]MDR3369580.1 hypothetical protein [Rhodoferax sp.]
MAVVIAQKQKIDRMRVTIPLNHLQSSMAMCIVNAPTDVATTLKLKPWRGKYRTGLMLRSDDGLYSLAQVIAGINKNGQRYFQWELWPDNLSPEGHRLTLNAFLDVWDTFAMNFDPVFDLGHVLDTGKVSYLELARDFVGVTMGSILPWTVRARVGTVYAPHDTDNPGGTIYPIGTSYIGSEESPRRYCIYDKKKELIDGGKPCPYLSLTRIEARLSGLCIGVSDLASLPDQFQLLNVASVSKAKALSNDKPWQGFIHDAIDSGTVDAFSVLSKRHKKKYKAQLLDCTPTWWSNYGSIDKGQSVHPGVPYPASKQSQCLSG